MNPPSLTEQIHAATDAIYSASPILSLGTSIFHKGPENSVFIKPGAIPLILILSYINSWDKNFTILSRAAFVIAYTPIVCYGFLPVTDDTTKIFAFLDFNNIS